MLDLMPTDVSTHATLSHLFRLSLLLELGSIAFDLDNHRLLFLHIDTL